MARLRSQGAYRSNSAATAKELPRRTRFRRRCSEPGSVGSDRPVSFDDGDMPLLTRSPGNDALSVRWLLSLCSARAVLLVERVAFFHRVPATAVAGLSRLSGQPRSWRALHDGAGSLECAARSRVRLAHPPCATSLPRWVAPSTIRRISARSSCPTASL